MHVNNNPHLARKYAWYFSAYIFVSGKRKCKDQSIFSRQMEAIVFYILRMFSETRAFLKMDECRSDSFQF